MLFGMPVSSLLVCLFMQFRFNQAIKHWYARGDYGNSSGRNS